jgi:hypothetical protein
MRKESPHDTFFQQIYIPGTLSRIYATVMIKAEQRSAINAVRKSKFKNRLMKHNCLLLSGKNNLNLNTYFQNECLICHY